MHSTRSTPSAASRGCLDRSLRIEREPDTEPGVPRLCDDGGGIANRLEMKRGTVAAGRGDLRQLPCGIVDHQMAVHATAGLVDERRDRLDDDGADRHGRDELPVADVDVEDPRAGVDEALDLVTEAEEVGRVEGGLDLRPRAPSRASSSPHLTVAAAGRRRSRTSGPDGAA